MRSIGSRSSLIVGAQADVLASGATAAAEGSARDRDKTRAWPGRLALAMQRTGTVDRHGLRNAHPVRGLCDHPPIIHGV